MVGVGFAFLLASCSNFSNCQWAFAEGIWTFAEVMWENLEGEFMWVCDFVIWKELWLLLAIGCMINNQSFKLFYLIKD